MKIREIRVQNFRNFGPELRSVKFYDEATGLVRPISVLVGSNGCGKTTLLEAVVSLLENASGTNNDRLLVSDEELHGVTRLAAQQRGAKLCVEVQFEALDEAVAQLLEPFWIGVDREQSKAPRNIIWNHVRLPKDSVYGKPGVQSFLELWARNMEDVADLRAGVLFLPHNRWIKHGQDGAISAPAKNRSWIYRFSPRSAWEGSLAQFWVWQNYLDLEQRREGRPNLAPFVETVEEILGRGRKVKISKGRVWIERPDLGDSVELHQLPSGEQQILTIFGEIIRMLRPGAVILIDEVEISLHPALQRAVLFHLRRLAAKYDLQVILTTHSMEIVSAVAPEEVINLDDMAVVEQKQAQGQA